MLVVTLVHSRLWQDYCNAVLVYLQRMRCLQSALNSSVTTDTLDSLRLLRLPERIKYKIIIIIVVIIINVDV